MTHVNKVTRDSDYNSVADQRALHNCCHHRMRVDHINPAEAGKGTGRSSRTVAQMSLRETSLHSSTPGGRTFHRWNLEALKSLHF